MLAPLTPQHCSALQYLIEKTEDLNNVDFFLVQVPFAGELSGVRLHRPFNTATHPSSQCFTKAIMHV